MKYLLIFITMIFLFISPLWACKCAMRGDFSLAEVEEYDYIALVKIGKTTQMDTTGEIRRKPFYFIAEIEEIANYKGTPLNQLKIIGGKKEFGYWSSCDFGIDEGEEWLIFRKSEEEGIFIWPCGRTVKKTTRWITAMGN